jgi:hypothetical protein
MIEPRRHYDVTEHVSCKGMQREGYAELEQERKAKNDGKVEHGSKVSESERMLVKRERASYGHASRTTSTR